MTDEETDRAFDRLGAGEIRRYPVHSDIIDELWAFRIDPHDLDDGVSGDIVVNAITFVDVSELGDVGTLRQAVPAFSRVLRSRYGLVIDGGQFTDATKMPVLAVIAEEDLGRTWPPTIDDVVSLIEDHTKIASMLDDVRNADFHAALREVL